MFAGWKFSCPFCGEVFTSDIKERVENDYTMHHQDNHCEYSIWKVNIDPEEIES